MEKYTVTGMNCAACSARVEKAVSALSGVSACSVNLLTGTMQVSGTASSSAIIAAVESAGYHAQADSAAPTVTPSSSQDTEAASLTRRLVFSLLFLLPLVYLTMGHNMFGFPLPAFFSGNPLALGLLQFLLAGAVLVCNRAFFIRGARGLFRRAPNMDTLVALGSGAAFLYSTILLLWMTKSAAPHALLHSLYFESAAMILVLITVGKRLEAGAKGRTQAAMRGLLALTPKLALVERDGTLLEIPAEKVKIGDVFILKSGASVPCDGEVLEGNAAISEAALTGESIPAEKEAGSTVSAGTICETGYLRCRATGVGENTTLARIIQLVSEASASKAPIARMADTVSGIFVPIVLVISLLTLLIWLLAGQTAGFALTRAITVLVVSCPCALGLATPVAIMVASGTGARHGILFKNAAALEMAGRIRTVVFDKTGTITNGTPTLSDILPLGMTEDALLTLFASLEAKSEHPLAQAITKAASGRGLTLLEISDFMVHPGGGVSGQIEEKVLLGGNARFMEKQGISTAALAEAAAQLADAGKTPLYFAMDGTLCGLLGAEDAPRPDSAAAISHLQRLGLRTVMLTGDTAQTASAIGRAVGITEVFASVLPDEKEATIRSLQKEGLVAMVGDGINDAPALMRADLGIAIGAGTDIAMESSDVVLTKSSLFDAAFALQLGRSTLRNIKENLFWAFLYNVCGIPLAAGALYPLWGLELSPMFGAAAMSLSSFCVVSNALRLYRVKPDFTMQKKKEEQNMEKVMKVSGMQCPHCEGRMQAALEAIPGVAGAICSHEKGTAVVTLSAPVSDAVLLKAAEDAGYPASML